MQPTRLPLSGGSGIEGPVGCGLYNVKAYAVSQRKRETALAPCATTQECGPMRGENKNPIRSHFEVVKRLAQYFYKSDSDRYLSKLRCAYARPARFRQSIEANLIISKAFAGPHFKGLAVRFCAAPTSCRHF